MGYLPGVEGSDCYYSIYWLGLVGVKQYGTYNGYRSVCEFAERNATIRDSAHWEAPWYPVAYDRWCKFTGSDANYPQICSEGLPMDKIMDWRYWKVNASTPYYNGYHYFLPITYKLLRWWPN